MKISEWKKHFGKKLKDLNDTSLELKEGDCLDLQGNNCIEKQLLRQARIVRGGGKFKVFYLEITKWDEFNREFMLVSEDIYVDEPEYWA
jgi:hypothetical protein